jgi:hypothetical protein
VERSSYSVQNDRAEDLAPPPLRIASSAGLSKLPTQAKGRLEWATPPGLSAPRFSVTTWSLLFELIKDLGEGVITGFDVHAYDTQPECSNTMRDLCWRCAFRIRHVDE